ncbi:hypothetical protein AB6A40_001402 [Gnathostoma spinigerum]|uniref:Uncharacterized protein n=1 Tax=Gnathostoma spinigerum TaxID=75299 RepID=A0ABD6E429_9BILA
MLEPQPRSYSNSANQRRSVANASEGIRKNADLFVYRQELAVLMGEKQKWLDAQRRASLLVEPCRTDAMAIMPRFAALLEAVSETSVRENQMNARRELLEQIIQESIFVEWPRFIDGLTNETGNDENNSIVEVDFAPLIHRARSVVKCRTSHPTMRIRICAISPPTESERSPVKAAFFRASLVKLSGDGSDRQVAGRLILTQREGTPANKGQDQSGAVVNEDGKLVIAEADIPYSAQELIRKFNETCKPVPFKYEKRALCATFPEMGVTLNSMVDRRQLATRYTIQVEVALLMNDNSILKHKILSHPFLIAITNDQTEPLLTSIFWNRLLDSSHADNILASSSDSVSKAEPSVQWRILREVLKHFVKAQYPQARALDSDELYHVQCMLFLPRGRSVSQEDLHNVEQSLFGNVRTIEGRYGLRKLKYRLLRESVLDEVIVQKNEFMSNKCISLADQSTELHHSLFQWMYKATEMIMDVGHKLCPSLTNNDKKYTKAKKQVSSSDDYTTMISLFNSRIITFLPTNRVNKVFHSLSMNDANNNMATRAMMVRFDDENAACLSLAFTNTDTTNIESSDRLPLMGSISCDQIKDFKQGLAEALMDEAFPSRYDRLVRLDYDHTDGMLDCREKFVASFPKKEAIFRNYTTLRMRNNFVFAKDDLTIRVNPLTGEQIPLSSIGSTPTLMPLVRQLSENVVQGEPLLSLPDSNNVFTAFLQFVYQNPDLFNQFPGIGIAWPHIEQQNQNLWCTDFLRNSTSEPLQGTSQQNNINEDSSSSVCEKTRNQKRRSVSCSSAQMNNPSNNSVDMNTIDLTSSDHSSIPLDLTAKRRKVGDTSSPKDSSEIQRSASEGMLPQSR